MIYSYLKDTSLAEKSNRQILKSFEEILAPSMELNK